MERPTPADKISFSPVNVVTIVTGVAQLIILYFMLDGKITTERNEREKNQLMTENSLNNIEAGLVVVGKDISTLYDGQEYLNLAIKTGATVMSNMIKPEEPKITKQRRK